MASKRLQQESFRKRKNNFIRRGHEISDRYKVGIWLCIQKNNGQLYIYNSDPKRSDWPPSSAQLTREDFIVEKPPSGKELPARASPSLPGYLSRPPMPEYSQEEIFSGQLLHQCRE
ncbi:hypothetical protein J3E71DRAFT_241135 [Bipolaris maydis]|nr:hypothetical protein J3E71DRAFT_241135 [Bipolaris maydis]